MGIGGVGREEYLRRSVRERWSKSEGREGERGRRETRKELDTSGSWET